MSYGAKKLPSGEWQFAVFADDAESVEVELYHSTSNAASHTVQLTGAGGHFATNVHGDYAAYGYRVWCGGQRSELLLDPYAIEIAREFSWTQEGFHPALGALVQSSSFDWQGVAKPKHPASSSLVYELHVRGMTMLSSAVPPHLRGTFLGLAHESVLEHLKRLGVTAVELLPVFYHADERFLFERGLTNYWGYNPVSFFALHPRFAYDPRSIRDEFRTMVREFHRAGIEVLLDVVFNHSGEGNETGPAISFRGFGEETFYRVAQGRFVDFTGCGNTLNTNKQIVQKLILSSLRYWSEEMGVDGFRFDLASALFRDKKGNFSSDHPLLQEISEDPVLSAGKLIAEPWDATLEGYRLGQFPEGWLEWNDRYRDTVRRFWRGDGGVTGEFATRISGSGDHFRSPARSINFVTAHDGFTLRDLVVYREKQNTENGHDNLDGTDANYAFGIGDPELALQLQKNLLATLFLSAGMPMFVGGDEFSRSQRGNNNAYCHDKEWNYLSWDGHSFVAFVEELQTLRKELGLHERTALFSPEELQWFTEQGRPYEIEDWNRGESQVLLAMFQSQSLLIALNPTATERQIQFPRRLELVLKTAAGVVERKEGEVILPERSFTVFRTT